MTHAFHPWHGQQFLLVGVRQNWSEDRVFFLDDQGVQHSLPVGWTDVVEPDPFVVAAAGRCPFRVVDLSVLAGLIDGLRGGSGSTVVLGQFCRYCKSDFAVYAGLHRCWQAVLRRKLPGLQR